METKIIRLEGRDLETDFFIFLLSVCQTDSIVIGPRQNLPVKKQRNYQSSGNPGYIWHKGGGGMMVIK